MEEPITEIISEEAAPIAAPADTENEAAQDAGQTASTVDGVRAIELVFRPVKRISNGTPAFYQSQMRLNTPSLGTLLPERYRAVIENTEQSCVLFRLGLKQLLRFLKNLEQRRAAPTMVSLYLPLRYLLTEGSVMEILALLEQFEVDTERICFEVSNDLLFQTDGIAAAAAAALSAEGIRFMLTGFGAAGCPMLGLAAFPIDYVILDGSLGYAAGKGERENACVKAMVDLASQLGAEIVAPMADKEQDQIFGSLGCVYSIGGEFMSGRYAFKKKSAK